MTCGMTVAPRMPTASSTDSLPAKSGTTACLATVAKHAVVPDFAGSESVLLAVGILGATVMPHVIYLHSALTQQRIVPRNDEEARKLYKYTRIDVVIAMTIEGLINMSMLVVAATVFFGSGLTNVESLEGAHRTLQPILGGAS